jgi:hypothetical protein
MSAIDLTIGGQPVRYHPAGTAVDGSDVADFNAEDDLLGRDHPRLRRIVVPLLPGGPPYMIVLHWSDGSDLDALDELLASGGNSDDYFANTVAGEFAHHLCRQCEWMFRVADSSTPLTSMLGIPLENGRRHVFQDNCPDCGAPTRRALLEFLTTGRKAGSPPGR